MKRFLTFVNILYALSAIVCIVLTVWIVVKWESIPDTIPSHYGASGEADAYGEKGKEMLFHVLFIWGLFLFMIVIHLICVFSTKQKTMTERERLVTLATFDAVSFMTLVMVCQFSYTAVQAAACKSLGSMYVPIVLVETMVLPLIAGVISYLIRAKRGY